jgi:UDP-glucuronate decarboxylase
MACTRLRRHLVVKPQEVIPGQTESVDPSEFTILELAQMIVALVGSRSKILHRALPENDPKQRQPNISLAQELLGWRPRLALDGLTRTVAYFE